MEFQYILNDYPNQYYYKKLFLLWLLNFLVNEYLSYSFHSYNQITPTEEQRKAADVNEDGKVDSGDALLILKYAAGLITEL